MLNIQAITQSGITDALTLLSIHHGTFGANFMMR
jgi:hypothetical protein